MRTKEGTVQTPSGGIASREGANERGFGGCIGVRQLEKVEENAGRIEQFEQMHRILGGITSTSVYHYQGEWQVQSSPGF